MVKQLFKKFFRVFILGTDFEQLNLYIKGNIFEGNIMSEKVLSQNFWLLVEIKLS